MTRPPHRCLGYGGHHCPALVTNRSRCHTCRTLMYGGQWAERSRQARAAHPYCTWCGTTTHLTLDHVQAGSTQQGVQVLCVSCNNKKAAGHAPPLTFS